MEIDNNRRRLGIQNVMANYSSNIWIFWKEKWNGKVDIDTIHITAQKPSDMISLVAASLDK